MLNRLWEDSSRVTWTWTYWSPVKTTSRKHCWNGITTTTRFASGLNLWYWWWSTPCRPCRSCSVTVILFTLIHYLLTLFRQVFMNLIGNALKFTEKGAVIVRMSLQQQTETHAMIKVEISDTGIGIPKSKLAQLFTPFITVVRESSKRKPGTGLGLSICKRLLHLMGGTISMLICHIYKEI